MGPKAEKGIKVGDRVGVGAQNSSCLKPDCEECSSGLEQHCTKSVNTVRQKSPFSGRERLANIVLSSRTSIPMAPCRMADMRTTIAVHHTSSSR